MELLTAGLALGMAGGFCFGVYHCVRWCFERRPNLTAGVLLATGAGLGLGFGELAGWPWLLSSVGLYLKCSALLRD